MKSLFAILALGLAATPADAQDAPLFVTDPDVMCPAIARGENVQEMGLVMQAPGFWETEYYCEFNEPLDFHWRDFRTEARLAVCVEPGILSPEIFAVQMFEGEAGTVRVWAQGADAPMVFTRCPE